MLGEATEEQRALLESHEPEGAEYRAEQAFLRQLHDEQGKEFDSGFDEADEAAIIEQAVDQALGEQRPASSARPRSRTVPLLLAAIGGAAAAAAVALALTKTPTPEAPTPTTIARAEPSTAPETIAAPSPQWSIISGRAQQSGADVDELTSGVPVDVVEALCATSGTNRACLNPGARFATTASGAFQLERGRLELLTGEDALDVVELGELRVVPQAHAAIIIERQVAGWSITVDDGSATVVESTSQRVIRSGESLAHDDRPAEAIATQSRRRDAASRKTAGELLRLARQQRRDSDPDGALSTYGRLAKQYPKSAAARAGAVSAGQLYLERGEAKAALRAFRRYLSGGGGGLREDAAYGEIRALRKLGRTAEAAKATARFQERYPESHYSAKLER